MDKISEKPGRKITAVLHLLHYIWSFYCHFLHDLLLLEMYSDGNFFLQAPSSPYSIIHSSQEFKLQRKTEM